MEKLTEKEMKLFVGIESDSSINNDIVYQFLDKIKKGFLLGNEHVDDMQFKTADDWFSINKSSPRVQWHFHTIGRGCSILFNIYGKDYSIDEIICSIIDRWLKANAQSDNFSGSDQAWSNHTVALRLEFFCGFYVLRDYFYKKNDEQTKLIKKQIYSHMMHILEHQDGSWNHGLDQKIALLKGYYILSDIKEMKSLSDNILMHFRLCFDNQGVTNEQSIMYHDYNIERFFYISQLMTTIGIDYDRDRLDLEKSCIFLLHSLMPNGFYSVIGDTVYRQPKYNYGRKYLQYMLSGGSDGIEPMFDKKKVYQSGYVFGRSEWDILKNPSYYSLRFGCKRIIHGHNDHMNLSYYANNCPLIIDGGFSGYTNDEYRYYFRFPSSHNVVTCEENVRFKWDEYTSLKVIFQSDLFDFYALEDRPYENVIRQRFILLNVDEDLFIVVDKISSMTYRCFSQNWHFHHELTAELESNKVIIEDNDNCKYQLSFFSPLITKLDMFQSRVNIHKQKKKVIGGVQGLGHNDAKPCYTLRNLQNGNELQWLTLFSKLQDNYLKADNRNVFFNCDYAYSLSISDNDIITFKGHVSNLEEISFDKSFVNSSCNYSLDRNIFSISNKYEKLNFFDINLTKLSILNDCEVVLLNVSIDLTENEESLPMFYYLTSVDGKARFSKWYYIDNHSKGILLRFLVQANSKLKVTLQLLRVSDLTIEKFNLYNGN